MKDDSLIYTLALIAPSGETVYQNKIRIYPLLRKENEMAGHARGIELAKEAMFHAGFWEPAKAAEREERRRQLLKEIEDAQKQLKAIINAHHSAVQAHHVYRVKALNEQAA